MIFLLNLPPPIHGMSFINQEICTAASLKVKKMHIINTSPSDNLEGVGVFKKVRKYISILLEFISVLNRTKVCDSIYRPINGGKGQCVDIVFVALMRLYKRNIFLHHHSYNYINKKSRLYGFLNMLAGRDAIHIVLAKHMQDGLINSYGMQRDQFRVLSNCAFINEQQHKSNSNNKRDTIRIGYLANVTITKGIDVYLKICKGLVEQGLNIKSLIAGPYNDSESEKIVNDYCTSNSHAEYLGALYGQQKKDFFRGIDIFIFPSKYKNEAEPLVIYEAASFGAYVIGSEVGSMRESIKKIAGISFPLYIDSNDAEIQVFIENVIEHIKKISKFNFDDISRSVITSFKSERNDNIRILHSLFEEFENVSAGKVQSSKRI